MMTVDEAYQHANDSLDWLGEVWFSFDPEKDARWGRKASDGLNENEAKMLSLCVPLQDWIDAGPMPRSVVAPAPIERLGFAEPSAHHLVQRILLRAVLRVCEVVEKGSTKDFDPNWGRTNLPSLNYETLLYSNRFAVRDAVRILTEDDFAWLYSAIYQEYCRASTQLEQPANSANNPALFASGVPSRSDITDLVSLIDAEKGKPKGEKRSMNRIALDFTGETQIKKSKAASLLAEIRRMKAKGKVNL